tara:strand:+ start:583 stop:1941 length:1359 start_codon:yes stop_codon:yes gene_type:complete
MKRIPNLSEFVNEANAFAAKVEYVKPALSRAADIVAKFVNKKTRKDFKKFPFAHTAIIDGQENVGVMFYSSKGKEAFRVSDNTSGVAGVIGSLQYFSNAENPTADFSLEAGTHKIPVIKLLHEFTTLVNDKKYAEEVLAESLVVEAKTRALSSAELKEVNDKLNAGDSVRSIALSLDVPYRQISRIKKGVSVKPVDSPAVAQNDSTLNDKVKYLEETMEDIYQISRRVGAGAFNSLFISGRAGTGKTYNVERALKDEGLVEDEDYVLVSGAASVIMMYKKFYQYRSGTLVFDDCDAVFRDENGRNLMKAALDTKKVRKISYLKKTKAVYDPKDVTPEEEFNLQEAGIVPNTFEFSGRVIFISNLPKDKADPDGAIRSRSILVDVNPDDSTLMERMKKLLPHLEPVDMPMEEKEEIYEFMKQAKDVSMRTFVKAAGFKMAGLPNWKRMAERYL